MCKQTSSVRSIWKRRCGFRACQFRVQQMCRLGAKRQRQKASHSRGVCRHPGGRLLVEDHLTAPRTISVPSNSQSTHKHTAELTRSVSQQIPPSLMFRTSKPSCGCHVRVNGHNHVEAMS